MSRNRIDGSRVAWACVALYASWSLRDFLQDGLPLEFDAHSHLARAWFVERAFEAGQYPTWANDWYGGYRLLEFYGPVWYWLTAAIGLLVRDVVLSTKLVVWASQVLSILLVFGFVKRVTARTLPAVLAAVLLVHSAERGAVLGIVGNYPTSLLYIAIPALLYLIWECTEEKLAAKRLFAGQSLLVGVMLASHFANTILVLPAILAFEVTRLAQISSRTGDLAKAFGAVAGSLLVAVVLVAFALAPALLDLGLVSLSLDGESLATDRIGLERVLIATGITKAGFKHPFLRDHGTFWMFLGIVVGLLSLRRSQRKWLPFFTGLCVTLLAVTLVDERAAIALAFFLYPLCAVAFDWLSRRAEASWPRGARFVVLAAIAGAIAFPVWMRPPRYVPSADFDVYRAIPETSTRSRTFDVTPSVISLDGFYGPSSFSPSLSGRAVPFGAYPQGAPLTTQVRLALASRLVRDLSGQNPVLSKDALDVLYMEHVEFLVARGLDGPMSPLLLASSGGEESSPGLLQLPHASPALFAPALALLPEWVVEAGARDRPPRLLGILERAWEADRLARARTRSLTPLFRSQKKQDWEQLLPLLRDMELDRPHARAARIFVDEPLPPAEPTLGGPAEFAVLGHIEEPTRVQIVARASQSGFARLSYARDPGLMVSLDGKPAETTADSLGGAITLAFPKGTHTIEIEAPVATLQTRGLWLSFFLVVALCAMLVRDRRATRSLGRHHDRSA